MHRLHEMALLQEGHQKPSITFSAATNLRVVRCTDISCINIQGANPPQLRVVEPNTRKNDALEQSYVLGWKEYGINQGHSGLSECFDIFLIA